MQPDDLVGEPRRGRTVVYTGDTRPAEIVATVFSGADLLIHEATFAREDGDRALDTGHSTAHEAAEVARDGGVAMLALTHVSPRYLGSDLLREAREVFPATVLPRDFDLVELPFPERGAPMLVKGGAHPDRAREEAATT